MKWNKLYEYPKSIREVINDQRHYAVGNEKLPSVTTILSATESEEKKQTIAKWKARVGAVEAERVKNTAATRGTAMHSYLEYHIAGQGLLDLTEEGVQAKQMAQMIVDKGFGDLNEIWGSECVLYYPELYAGQTDLCGVYQGRESIVDFKQSNKPKREEYIGDYYLQLVAYAMAHDAIYKTNIEQGVILMCTPDLYFQKFVLNGARFRQVKWEWLRRVDEYYKNKKANV
jgi:ATP-dependent exoDNAse (exonuclease V) beta subunit